MLWFIIAIIAYFCNAIASTIDKILLSKDIPHPRVYVFYIGILGLLGLVLAPFGMTLIPLKMFWFVLMSGCLSVLALWMFFKALIKREASGVVSFVGAVQPIIILILASIFIGERLRLQELVAVFILIIGSALLTRDNKHKKENNKYDWILYAMLSGIFFGIMHFLNKFLFTELGFINGFVWPRITTALCASSFLISSSFIKELKNKNKDGVSKKGMILFLMAQLLGAMFFILVNYAISLGSVTLVNALQGIQFVFVFIFMIILSKLKHIHIKDKFTKNILFKKLIGIILISIGIAMIML